MADMKLSAERKQVLPFTEEDLAGWFSQGMECIGEGSRRKVFRVPNQPYCVKFYRLPSEYTRKTRFAVKFEIASSRYSDRFNISCQEWRYYRKLRSSLPPEVLAAFPETVERVRQPDRGWGLAENLLLNADGSPMRRVSAEMRRTSDANLRSRLYRSLASLYDALVAQTVRFYDPPNILVQWLPDGSFRLRIVNFEPRGRTLFPSPAFLPAFIRWKVRRRCNRYLARLASLFSLDSPRKG